MGVLSLVAVAQVVWLLRSYDTTDLEALAPPKPAAAGAASPEPGAADPGAPPEVAQVAGQGAPKDPPATVARASAQAHAPSSASSPSPPEKVDAGAQMHEMPLQVHGENEQPKPGDNEGGGDIGVTAGSQMTFADFSAAVQILARSSYPLTLPQKKKASIFIRDYAGAATRIGKAVDGIYLLLTTRQRNKLSSLPPLPPTTTAVAPGRAPEVERLVTLLGKKAAEFKGKSVPQPKRAGVSTSSMVVDRFTLFDGIAALESQGEDNLTIEQAVAVSQQMGVVRDSLMKEYQIEQQLGGLLTPDQLRVLSDTLGAAEREANLPNLLLNILER